MAELFFEWVVTVGAQLRCLGALTAALVAFGVVRPRLRRTGNALTVAALMTASPPAFWYALEIAGLELGELATQAVGAAYLLVILGTVWRSVQALASDARAASERDSRARDLSTTFE